jgi:hypothetical protein
MPWHKTAMKDVTTNDMLRLGGINLGPVDFRMGQPTSSNVDVYISESIGYDRQTW